MNFKGAADLFSQLQAYLQTAWDDRRGSAALWALIFLLFILVIRGWVLGPLTRRVKMLDKNDIKLVKKYYSRRSLWGWIFFLLSLCLALGLWINLPPVPLTLQDLGTLLILLLSILMGIILHVMAIGAAALRALRDHKKEPEVVPHAHQKNYSLS